MARGMHLSKGPSIKQFIVKGGAAGSLTVTGISTSDVLLGVSAMKPSSATGVIATVLNLLSEFTISAANTIDNTDGTVTTGFGVIVTYEDVDG
jgi:hypothetical protein